MSTLLLIDNIDSELLWAKRVLEGAGFEIRIAESEQEIEGELGREDFDLVLADSDRAAPYWGRLREAPHGSLPILLLVPPGRLGSSFRDGVADLLLKPVDAYILLHRVRYHLERSEKARKQAREGLFEEERKRCRPDRPSPPSPVAPTSGPPLRARS